MKVGGRFVGGGGGRCEWLKISGEGSGVGCGGSGCGSGTGGSGQ